MRAEERVAVLHAKMNALRRSRERRKTRAVGAACAVLACCLLLAVFGGGAAHPGGTAGVYSGSTMLFENAGGYVLLALGAFMAGVIITAAIMKKREKNKEKYVKKAEGKHEEFL